MNFAKFLRTPFLQNTSGRLLLLRLKCKLKLWLQSKRIYTSLPWSLRRLSYKPSHLKQHHCNNSWKFKILQQMSSEYLPSASAYRNWLLICEIGNKWHICISVYLELTPASQKKNKNLINSLERTHCFRKLINGFFPILCLHYIYLD